MVASKKEVKVTAAYYKKHKKELDAKGVVIGDTIEVEEIDEVSKPSAAIHAPADETSDDTQTDVAVPVDVYYHDPVHGPHVRTFSREIHGDDYKAVAENFKTTRNGSYEAPKPR